MVATTTRSLIARAKKSPDLNYGPFRIYRFNARSTPQNTDARLLRHATHSVPAYHHSPLSPLPDLSDFRGPPTPPPDPKPIAVPQARLARSITSGRRKAKSRSRTPPIYDSDPLSSQSLLSKDFHRSLQYPRDPSALLAPGISHKPAGITIPFYPPNGSPRSCAFSNPFSSNLPSPQTPEPERWSLAGD